MIRALQDDSRLSQRQFLVCVSILTLALLFFVSASARADTTTVTQCGGGGGGGVHPLYVLDGHGDELCGEINPNGATIEGCRFEFGTQPGVYPYEAACDPGPPYSGQGPVEVTATLTGLEPNNTYYYRLAVSTTNGTITGDEEQFVTESVPPQIENLEASAITDDNATLEAEIAPVNRASDYELVIAVPCAGPPPCTVDVPVATGTISASTSREQIGVDLAGKEHLDLQPDTTYEYWVRAENSASEKSEAHGTFTTLKDVVAEEEATLSKWVLEGAEREAKEAPRIGAEEAAKKKEEEERPAKEAAAAAARQREVREAGERAGREAALKEAAAIKKLEEEKRQSELLARTRKLSKALRVCRKSPNRSNRARCERRAEEKYGSQTKKTHGKK
jgi:hypothetical protein